MSVFSSVSLQTLNNSLPRIKRKNSFNSSEHDYESYQSLSDLNCWYRQLGGASQNPTQPKIKSMQPKTKKGTSEKKRTLKLPMITESGLVSSNSSTPLGWPAKLARVTKKKKKLSELGPSHSLTYTESFVIDKENASPSNSVIDRTNLFVMKCIGDVEESNRPDKMKLSEPRELKYVNELSELRYMSVGFGKSYGYKWNIELFRI
jgi:hypothetical protein